MTFVYSDIDGSSKAFRELLKSDKLVDYVKELPSVDFEFFIKRNRHPRLVAQYANGYTKAVGLRKHSQEEILRQLFYCKNEGGHAPYVHGGKGVITFRPSIQGPYSQNTWNIYPTNKLEKLKLPENKITYEANTEPKQKRRSRSVFLHYNKMKVKADFGLPIRHTSKL